jgi:hypothetical protein
MSRKIDFSKSVKPVRKGPSIKANFQATTAYFVFAPPVRPGSTDAYKLPSMIQGSLRWPRERPAPEKGAFEV